MKTFTRSFLLMAAIVASINTSYAALPPIDFETVGNTWSWSTFEFAPTWSIVANPSATGINTSAHVGKLVVNPTDQPWAGVQCAKGEFGPLTLTAENHIIKVMVYKDVISPVGVKLVTATDASKGEIKVSNTKINEWEELTFDFTSQIDPGFVYTGIVFFTDFPAARTAGSTSYIDNIVYDTVSDTDVPTGFTATLGGVNGTNVNLLLNATDNSGVVKYKITYGSTVLNTTGTSGVEKQYTVTGLTAFTPYTFSVECMDAAGNPAANNPIVVNATTGEATTTTATIDFETVGNLWGWSKFETNSGFTIAANPSATGINTSANTMKVEIGPTQAPYEGIQTAHGDFGPFSLAVDKSIIKIMVYKDVISPVGIKLAAADGWSKGEKKISNTKINEWEELTFDFTDFIDPGQPSPYDQIIIFPDFPATRTAGSTTYIDNIVYTPDVVEPDTEAPTAFTATAGAVSSSDAVLKLNATDNSGNVKYTITYGSTVLNTNGTSGVEKPFLVTGLDASTAYSFSVVCKDAAGNAAANNPIVVAVTTSAAMAAAPVPTLASDNVKSVFSDTYTPEPSTLQDWYGNTFSTVSLGGNETLKNTTVCCFGYEFTAKPIDLSSMTKLHVDIYPVTLPSITIGLVANGEFKKSNIALTAGQWNSIDVTLADLAGVNLAAVNQVGFWDMNGTFYLDNLYFWKVGTGLNTEKMINISFYPNPVRDMLNINTDVTIKEIRIQNVLGQTVMQLNGYTEKGIDVKELQKGNYLITVKSTDNKMITDKFIKM